MSPARRTRKPPDLIAAGLRWLKIEKAITWRPGEGEVLQGRYVGARNREGSFGLYTLHTVRTEAGRYSFSGSVITALITDAGVIPGDLVRVVYLGKRCVRGTDREYKDFELYVSSEKECEL
jgi:hypothetical protein